MATLAWFMSSYLQAAATMIGLLSVHILGLAVYRLFLSPLARIPGPKLAAVSLWYEFYWDVVRQGRYTWKIAELHAQYGPIIRINPYEIHISDPEYYFELYAGPAKRRDKWAWSSLMFGNSSSVFGTVPHELHRRRRAPLNPFFSKASIKTLEPMIRSKAELLCSRLEGFRHSQQPVNLRHAFGALAMDVVTDYAFGTSYNCLDDPLFSPIWLEAIDSSSVQSHLNKQFPWILSLMRLTPVWIVERLNPHVMRLIRFQIDMTTEVLKHMSGEAVDSKGANHRTILHELLKPNALPAEDQTLPRLVDEAFSMVGAGQGTTTNFLNITTFHILACADVLTKLKAELKQAMPEGSLPDLQVLERLPYLSAVILEGHRLSYGVSHRLQRVSPDEDLIYKSYVIPSGTPVSMTSVLIHENPELFPKPLVFSPERWLEPGSKEQLQKYLVNFSKGTRGCLGQHLAQAEIHLTLAAIFSRFDMHLTETTREDIDVAHDFFNPQPRKGSVGLRAIID